MSFSFVVRFIQDRLKQDVLIINNKGDRDTLGLFLVYCHLKYKYKLKVKIHSTIFLQKFWIKLYRPTVCVNIFIDNKTTEGCYRLLKEIGTRRIMSPTETFVYGDENFFLGPYYFNEHVDKILLAGDKMKEVYLRNNRVDESKIKVIGYPTFDWSGIVGKECMPTKDILCKKYGIPTNKKIILLATSFNMADLEMDKWDEKYIHLNITKERALEIKENTKIIRDKTLQYITKLLDRNPDWCFVIKKHPFEKPDEYLKRFSKNKNVFQLHSTQFYDLMFLSDVLIHWHSTTSIQAWMANKSTVLPWFKESAIVGVERKSDQQLGNYICQTFNELESSITKILNGDKIPRDQSLARERYIKEWFYSDDGLSSERASGIIYADYLANKDNKIKYTLTPIELLRNIPKIIKYLSLLQITKLYEKIGINFDKFSLLKVFPEYDSFCLELHRMRYESKIKSYLNDKN